MRTCKLNLSPQAIARGKYGVCLQYHLGNCKGPCVGAQSEEEYAELTGMVKSVLRGDLRPVRQYLEQNMQDAAEALRFEQAQRFKQRLEALENYQSRSVIVSAKIVDCDIFSLLEDDDVAYCNFIRLRNGSIVALHTVRLTTGVDATREDMLSMAIQHIVENISHDLSREVIVPFMPSAALLFDKVVFTIPKRGEKADLLEFSLKSARIYRSEQMKNLEIKNPERHTERLMNAMQRELHLDRQPRHIECFDNSNIQGTNPVSACVVFRNAKPSKRDYRHFLIKTVEGPNDFASMKEVLTRRYSRLLQEGQGLPQLIVVDCGKGQLRAAVEVLDELGLRGKIAIIGIAERLEEIYFPGDSVPLYIDKNSESLKVIQHLRDEAHRFGITHHRNRRSKSQVVSALDSIKGVGEKTRTTLLQHFKSLKRIREASLADITAVIGPAKAQIVYETLHTSEESK